MPGDKEKLLAIFALTEVSRSQRDSIAALLQEYDANILKKYKGSIVDDLTTIVNSLFLKVESIILSTSQEYIKMLSRKDDDNA